MAVSSTQAGGPFSTAAGTGNLPAGTGMVKVVTNVGQLAVANVDFMPAVGGTALVKVTGGAAGAAVANTDYMAALGGTSLVKVVAGVPTACVAGTDFMAALAGTSMVKVVAGVPTAAVAGTDFQAPLVANTDYAIPTRTLTAGAHIAAIGDLSANRTIGLAAGGPGAATYGGGGVYVNSITLDAQGIPTAITTGTPAGGTSWPLANDVRGVETNKALTVLAAATHGEWIAFIAGPPGTTAATGAGTFTANNGYSSLASTAAGNTGMEHYFRTGASTLIALPTGTGGEWYMSCRLRITGTLDAATRAHFGGGNGVGTTLRVGHYGPQSATNWIVQSGGGGTITSGTAIDTSWHTLRVYRVGGTTTFELDGVSQGTSTTAYPSVANAAHVQVYSGNASTATTMDVAWQFLAVKQP